MTNQTRDVSLNLYEYKLHKLENYASKAGERGVIGLPMALNMYEMYPFWHAFFTELGYEVKMSGFSNRKLYLSGQGTIPSDTVYWGSRKTGKTNNCTGGTPLSCGSGDRFTEKAIDKNLEMIGNDFITIPLTGEKKGKCSNK